MRFKKILIVILSAFLLTILILVLNAFYVEVKQLEVKTVKIEAPVEKPLRLIYFSDLHYNLFVDHNRLLEIVATMNQQHADFVFFGGDLIDNVSTVALNQKQLDELIAALSSIEAPYGKFAVLGEQEVKDANAKSVANFVLGKSQFEVVSYQSLTMVRDQDKFQVIGLGADSPKAIFHQQKPLFTLAFGHFPAEIEQLKNLKVNIMLAGATHGGQINVPLFREAFIRNQAAYKNQQLYDDTLLLISNGLGQVKINARLFAPPQIIVIELTNDNID